MSDAEKNAHQGVGPDKTPESSENKPSVPDPEQDQSAPIPFAHDDDESENDEEE